MAFPTNWQRVMWNDINEVKNCAAAFRTISQTSIDEVQLFNRLQKYDRIPHKRNPMLEVWIHTQPASPDRFFVVALDRTLFRLDNSPNPTPPRRNDWCISVGISDSLNNYIKANPADPRRIQEIYVPLRDFVVFQQQLNEPDNIAPADQFRQIYIVWPQRGPVSLPPAGSPLPTEPVDQLFQLLIDELDARVPPFTLNPTAEDAYGHYFSDPKVAATGRIWRVMIPTL